MEASTIFCPGGSDSQTGSAVKERYPDSPISDCGNIPDVPPQLETNSGPYVIPIWNSHQGEVKAAEYVWDHIQEAKIKVSDIWAKMIEFWFVRRTGTETAHGKIGSVVVAKTQCSGFLKRQGAELDPCALTTVAFSQYRQGKDWDGVLVAPGQGENEAGYEVVSRQTANPNNFTSFVKFLPSGAFSTEDMNVNSVLTGVTMRLLGESLGDIEQSFFEAMLSTITDLANIPKLIFVLTRTSKVGLLFEGAPLYAGDLLDAEELESGEIMIYENAGATARLYTEELSDLFGKHCPDLVTDDFILHRGINTCLFVCPPLGLYTHGYEIQTVEPVIRFYISRLFQLWDDGVKCTPEQSRFFDRHKKSWQEKGSQFIQFKIVNPTDG